MQSQQKAGLSLFLPPSLLSLAFTDTESEAEEEEIREGVERGEDKGRVKEKRKQKERESKVYRRAKRLRLC